MKLIKDYFDNRELSWLKFNERVLEEAEDVSVPLFERLRFVSIFCSNLDEFFMIRVGSLRDQTLLKKEQTENKTNLTASEQLELINKRVTELIPRKDAAYFDIFGRLHELNIVHHLGINEINENDEVYLKNHFKNNILPLLSPSIIDKKHPVQFLKNKDLYICALLKRRDSEKNSAVTGILPAYGNDIFERVIFLPPEKNNAQLIRFVLAEQVILHFLNMVLKNYEIEKKFIFRITRNADIDVNEALFDQDLDFRDIMEELLKKRKKLAPVRIELDSGLAKAEVQRIVAKLNLQGFERSFAYIERAPFDISFISELEKKLKDCGGIFSDKLVPRHSCMVDQNEKIMKQLDRGDILLSYPYESINPFIRLLEEAAVDKDVISIKITLYRVARESKIIDALITAAENGKDTLALVELRARFDEENNIGWSKRLEEEGVGVIYGPESIKVHSKLLLITKKTDSSVKYYTQIGTGNYNERTSKLYTDLTLMTANQDIGADAVVIFDALLKNRPADYTKSLWAAPKNLKQHVIDAIEAEIAYKDDGYIGLKLNSLTDKDIIEKLAEASQNGVKINLLIRGICCLIAGVPGKTENITVTSVVGRFLEHSRIYIFGKGERRKLYISSADFMTRNTERRVEVAAPVYDAEIKKRITEEFEMMLNDNIKARDQSCFGVYKKRGNNGLNKTDKQLYFYRIAYENEQTHKIETEKLSKEENRTYQSFFKKMFKKTKKNTDLQSK